jgi:hypothetical protein
MLAEGSPGDAALLPCEVLSPCFCCSCVLAAAGTGVIVGFTNTTSWTKDSL